MEGFRGEEGAPAFPAPRPVGLGPHCSRTAGQGPLTPAQALGLLAQVRLPPGAQGPRAAVQPTTEQEERSPGAPRGPSSRKPIRPACPSAPRETPTTAFLAHLLDVPRPRHWPVATSPLPTPPPAPVCLPQRSPEALPAEARGWRTHPHGPLAARLLSTDPTRGPCGVADGWRAPQTLPGLPERPCCRHPHPPARGPDQPLPQHLPFRAR